MGRDEQRPTDAEGRLAMLTRPLDLESLARSATS